MTPPIRRSCSSYILVALLSFAVSTNAQTIAEPLEGGLDGLVKNENLGVSESSSMGGLEDELMFFEEIPVVVTAARRSQRITQSCTAVSIITSNDIFYGGHTSVPEMLQFSPSLDILFTDRNNVALGVRGLHHQLADRTLVLLDGRNATSAVFGGTDFFRLPVFPADIERIEVVRGPGGASWGANAFNGVINIIQKKPKDVPGLYADVRVNEFGDTFNHFRWADQERKWCWRVSGGYETRESSEDSIDNDNFFSNDASRDWRVNTQAIYEISEMTDLDLGAAFVQISRGDLEIGGFPGPGDPRKDESIGVVRLHGRVNHEFHNGSSGYLQWFTNIEDVERPSVWTYKSYETDLESQLDIPISNDNKLSVGGSLRWIRIESDMRRATDFLEPESVDELWGGLFFIDEWNLTNDLTVETQVRGDWYSETELDWSGRLSLLYTLDNEEKHAIRASAAKAFRAPSYGLREGSTRRVPLPSPPLPPGSFAVNLLEAGDLDNEETYYFETGYTAMLLEGLTLSTTGYYQIYEDLIGLKVLPDPLGAGRGITRLENIDGAKSFGAEVELTYSAPVFTVSAWYAHNNFETDGSGQSIRAFDPAKNKVGLSARFLPPYGFTGNVNYKYVGKTKNDAGGPSVSEWHRLDLSLSKTLVEERLELTFGVRDVFDETEQRVNALGAFTAHDTPGRTIFAQLKLQF